MSWLVLVVVPSLLLVSCSRQGADTETDVESTPIVYAVNYPLAYFAERIGSGLVEVMFPAPPAEDPAFWQPDVDTIGAYQGADLILLNGAGYAGWARHVSLPPSRLVDTSSAFPDRLLPAKATGTHRHGPTGDHVHGSVAFTTWLDPTLAIEQAVAIRDAFVSQWPQHEEAFDNRLALLSDDLLDLDRRGEALAAALGNTALLASHPVYQYLAKRYDLNLSSLHWEPDEVPDDQALRELEQIVETHPAKWMIWEGDPAPETEQRLEEMGIRGFTFAPCGNRPDSGDYLSVMRQNVERLKQMAETRDETEPTELR